MVYQKRRKFSLIDFLIVINAVKQNALTLVTFKDRPGQAGKKRDEKMRHCSPHDLLSHWVQ